MQGTAAKGGWVSESHPFCLFSCLREMRERGGYWSSTHRPQRLEPCAARGAPSPQVLSGIKR